MLAFALLAAVGCRARTSAAPEEPAKSRGGEPWPSAPPAGFAVLPWGTRVFFEPRFGGPWARLGGPFASPPPWPIPGHVVRVLGERDGFVEIAPLLGLPLTSSSHCGPVLDGEAFDVRLYVSPWSLATVLTRTIEEVDEAAGELELRPGAVVAAIPDDPQGRFAVSAAGILVRARVPRDAVGRSYAAAEPLGMPSERRWQVPVVPMTHDGLLVELEPSLGSDIAVASVAPDAEGQRIELISPCARVTVLSAQEPPAWPHQIHFEPHFEFGLGATELELPEGIPLAPVAELGPEPELPAKPLEESLEESLEEPEPVLAFPEDEQLLGELVGVGGLGLAGLHRPEWVFEQGAPVYLSPAGPAAGTLSQLRIFSDDAWSAGDRLCFRTTFGARFSPPVAVCMDGIEARLRNPLEDQHDFQAGLLQPGPVRVIGALDEAEVERVLRVHRHELRRCAYEQQQRGIRGPLALTLHVSGTGRVTRAQLRSLPIEGVSKCALTVAKGWTLPASRDGKASTIELELQVELQ